MISTVARQLHDAKQHSPAENKELIVAIVGSGNSAHVCAALVHGNTGGRFKVQIFTKRPNLWSKTPLVKFPDGSTQEGLISVVSNDPAVALKDADLILWTGPVNVTKDVLESIRPYVDLNKTVVGTIFAQGLFHLLAYRIFGPRVKLAVLRNIPWLCRTTLPGKESQIVGPKATIEAVIVNLPSRYLEDVLFPIFNARGVPAITQLADFAPIVFNPANQIIHPARYWGIFRKWSKDRWLNKSVVPEWLYRDMDEVSGAVLEVLDDELQAIRTAYYEATGVQTCNAVLPLRERLLLQYGEQIKDTSTMARMIGTNLAYALARTPVKVNERNLVGPDPSHRVVLDDIGWGLCVLVSIARRLNVPTIMMNMLVLWHQGFMGKEYLNAHGVLAGKDVHELVLIGSDDPLEWVARFPVSKDFDQKLAKAELQSEEQRIGNP